MKTFYSVEWNGVLIRWDLVEENEVTGKWYNRTHLLESNDADEWLLKENKPKITIGRCNLSDTFITEQIENGKFFLNLEDATVKSKEYWDVFFAPNAMWQVVEIFDNVEVTPKSKPMPKAEAKRELKKYKSRPYVSYEIRVVKKSVEKCLSPTI